MEGNKGVVLALLFSVATGLFVACNGGGGSSSSENVVPPNSLLDVTTYHNDNMRTGQNNNETVLTRAKVNSSGFGKIGALPVDGVIYTQPLYVKNVTVNGARHDVVYVGTENEKVYAFDADTLSSTPLWTRDFTGDSEYPCKDCTYLTYEQTDTPAIYPNIGITATPVIDMSNGVMYVIATTSENGTVYQKIHGLYLSSGKEMPGSPVAVQATVPGTGYGSTNGLLPFYPAHQLSRAGLALTNGRLIVGFSSYNDIEPAHGWLFSYNASNLQMEGVWVSTPHSGDGNIWMAGGAPVIDQNGYIYFATGNGDPSMLSPIDYHDSVLKIMVGSNGSLSMADFFQPWNYVALAEGDVDLGSGAVMAPPDQPGSHPHLLLAGGKQGTIYLLNRDNLGKNIITTNANATADTQIVEEIVDLLPGGKNYGPGIYSTPAYFSGKVFYCGAGDYLRSFPLVNGLLSVSTMTQASQQIAHEGASPSISSNGEQNGIVWISDPSAYSYTWATSNIQVLSNGPAVLYAYSTDDLSTPLYASNDVPSDAAGDAMKFAVPTVTDGKVFLGTQTEVSVYGLKSTSLAAQTVKISDRAPASVKEKPTHQYIFGGVPNPRDVYEHLACGRAPTNPNEAWKTTLEREAQ